MNAGDSELGLSQPGSYLHGTVTGVQASFKNAAVDVLKHNG